MYQSWHSCYTCGTFMQKAFKKKNAFCRSLQSRTKGVDLLVNEDFTTAGLQWKKFVRVCMDGAGTMLDKRTELAAKVKEHANKGGTLTRYTIYREVYLQPKECHLNSILFKTINFIKSNALSIRLFSTLCTM